MGKRMVPAPTRTPAPTNPHRFTPPPGEFCADAKGFDHTKGCRRRSRPIFFPEEPFRRRENDRLSTPFSTTKAGKSEEPKGEGRSPPTGTATPTPTNARTQPPQATERGGGTAKPSRTKGAKKAPPSMTERPRGRTRTTVGAVRRWPPCSLLTSFRAQPASFCKEKLAGRLGAVQSSFFRSPTGFHKEGPAQTSNQYPPPGGQNNHARRNFWVSPRREPRREACGGGVAAAPPIRNQRRTRRKQQETARQHRYRQPTAQGIFQFFYSARFHGAKRQGI